VTVTVVLAGGAIQESPEDRGVSEAASLAWTRPATGSLSSTNIRDLLTGRKVSVSGRSGLDTMALTVSGSPADLEEGMQLAHLLLTDPVVEPAAFDQWKEQQRQVLDLRGRQIELAFVDLVTDTIYPEGEHRVRPLTGAQIDALTRDAAEAWLRALVASAPIEVSVVGDIPRERALELVLTYLGSLRERPRISAATLAERRAIARPRGPLTARRSVPTQTDKALALVGFFGAERRNVQDTRLLNAAARILSTRMIRSIREERQLVYSIGVESSPALEFPGYGTVEAYSFTDPGKVEELVAAVRAMYDDFARDGPTEDEMRTMRKQMANTLDERMREPSFWSRVVSTSTYRGWSLDDTVGEPAAYEAMTGAEVREAFARYRTPGATFEIAATPGAPPPPPGR
jgi:zinc protease